MCHPFNPTKDKQKEMCLYVSLYSNTKYYRPNIDDGLNFVTCEQMLRVALAGE